MIVVIVQCSAGKTNDKYNCKPVTCKIMSGPFKSLSIAEYSGHLTSRLRHLNSVFRAHGTKFFCDSPLN